MSYDVRVRTALSPNAGLKQFFYDFPTPYVQSEQR